MDRLFCSVCGSEQQLLIQEMPKNCDFSHLGGHICLECCKKCNIFDGCPEIQARLHPLLERKSGINSRFLGIFFRGRPVVRGIFGDNHS